MQRPTVHDLSAWTCKHLHEEWWRWKTSTIQTAQAVEQRVCSCLKARCGLETGCAHTGIHLYNATDIFNHDLGCVTWLTEDAKKKIRQDWQNLCSIKSYIDQLHRKGHGGDLDKVWGWYSESPYHAAITFLSANDPLRYLFFCISSLLGHNIIDANYWSLLHQAEAFIMSRKWSLLEIVQKNTPKPIEPFRIWINRKSILNEDFPDDCF